MLTLVVPPRTRWQADQQFQVGSDWLNPVRSLPCHGPVALTE
jgi:hypothetical protein